MQRSQPSRVKNKMRRQQLVLDKKTKKGRPPGRKDPNRPRQDPETIESKRVVTDDLLLEHDPDVDEEEAADEFAPFFSLEKTAKILLTTSEKPSRVSFVFLLELKNCLPNSFYYPRKFIPLAELCKEARTRGFTHVLVLHERLKKPFTLSLAAIDRGPTLLFRIRRYMPTEDIPNRGNATATDPELIVRNFHTPLGRRVARFFGSMFPQSIDLKGRTVVSLYNFRDFVFFRHHRYTFKNDGAGPETGNPRDKGRAVLQEIGPRMVLQLRKAYSGVFDEQEGRFEYFYRGGFYVKRNKFFL